MAGKRKVANLTALAVLSVVAAKPMHPYEMARAMRGWGKDRDMAVKWGSLYSVVASMEKKGLLEAAGTAREGNRPERKVYRITPEGHAELVDWARDLLATADGDTARFRAGLSVAAVLPPDEVAALLRGRIAAMEERIAEDQARLDEHAAALPAVFLIEDEYTQALARAEIAWARSLLDRIETGSLGGVEQWRSFHETGEVPDEVRDLADRRLDGPP